MKPYSTHNPVSYYVGNWVIRGSSRKKVATSSSPSYGSTFKSDTLIPGHTILGVPRDTCSVVLAAYITVLWGCLVLSTAECTPKTLV